MTRWGRWTLVLGFASALFGTPRVAVAQRVVNVATLLGGASAQDLCCAVRPVIHAMRISVPSAGSGDPCTDDTQCPGDGAYCGFDLGASSGSCKASGLLSRGDIHYVAGGLVDLEVTIPKCTSVEDVSMNDASRMTASWSLLSSSATTVNGAPALRQRVRIAFPNGGDGHGATLAVHVGANTSIATTTRSLQLALVAAVNAPMRTTVAETRVRNALVASLYEHFGDDHPPGDIADEALVDAALAEALHGALGADANDRLPVCDSCRVVGMQVGGGKIDLYTLPPSDRVRVNIPTASGADATADPARGLLLPSGMLAPIVAGGSYAACQASTGESPATCKPYFALDMAGLFNWWGSDVPVPSPISYDESGAATVFAGRYEAWARLQGLARDVAALPARTFPVGALLARRTPVGDGSPNPRALVTNGCVMPPHPHAPYRVSLGVNDVAAPANGAPPTHGKLEATVLIAADAAQSEALFGTRERCVAEPAPLRHFVAAAR